MANTPTTRTYMPAPAEPEKPVKTPKKMPSLPKPKVPLKRQRLLIFLVLALAAFSIFMFVQYKQAKDQLTGEAAKRQTQSLLSEVEEKIILPKNETPTIYTVKDVQKLKSQSFYADAKNDDQVIIYPNNKKALLYRPSTGQIVNVDTITAAPTSQ